MLESHIQSKIIKYLESLGMYVVKVGLANRNGVPDILACHLGKFIGFEVKQEGKEASPLQLYNKRRIHHAGGLCFTVRSVAEVKEIVGGLEWSKV